MKKKNAKIEKARQGSVQVEGKKDVVLIESGIGAKTEEEIRELFERISYENQQMKERYYSKNSSITTVRQRTFLDLVRKFIQGLTEDLKENGFSFGFVSMKT